MFNGSNKNFDLECEGSKFYRQDTVRSLVVSSRADIVCVQETKITAMSQRVILSSLESKKFPSMVINILWSNQQDSPTLVKLDRVLCSVDWEDKFPNCLLQSMASEDSDHCPLLLGLQDNKVGRRRFHFESFWTRIDGFQEVVAAAWTSVPTSSCPYLTLSQKFKATARGLQRWSSKTVGNVKFQLALAREILHQFEIAQDNLLLSPGELCLKNNLKKHSLALASLSRTIDRLRSRIGWLREGDVNTKLFHLHACHRKRNNFIGHLISGDRICTSYQDKA